MDITIEIPFFPGFYCTELEIDECTRISEESDYYFEEYGVDLDEDNDFEVDYKRYEADAARLFVSNISSCTVLNSLIQAFHLDTIEIDSPRYYNFRNDKLYCKVTMAHEWILTARDFLKSNFEVLSKLISEDWTSRDGFMSLMSNDINEWIEALEKEPVDERYVSEVIKYMLYLDNEHIADDLVYSTVESLYENFDYIQLSDSGSAKVKEAKGEDSED